MAIQKKSLIGSRPAEPKAKAQPVKGTETIGEAKAITATSLSRKSAKMLRGMTLKATAGFAHKAAKKK
jgi:hypothetical protein